MVLCSSSSSSSVRLLTFYTLPDTKVLNSFEEAIYLMRIEVYMYACECMCVLSKVTVIVSENGISMQSSNSVSIPFPFLTWEKTWVYFLSSQPTPASEKAPWEIKRKRSNI